jgi:hypothetical protein
MQMPVVAVSQASHRHVIRASHQQLNDAVLTHNTALDPFVELRRPHGEAVVYAIRQNHPDTQMG